MNSTKIKTSKKPAFDAVIFDIDNVLIDTRRSYLDAIRWTVEIYLTSGTIPFFLPSSKRKRLTLLTPGDVTEFKMLGGFNDDWDCCYGILLYLTTLPVKQRTIDHLKKVADIHKFAQSVKRRPLKVSGITKRLGRPRALKIEKIARIFQEVYLGKDFFKIVERKTPQYWKRRGLIYREKLIFRKSTLHKLKNMGVQLGIATGRSYFETIFALKRFDVLDYFNSITTMDEVKRAEYQMKQSLRKPHPYSLLTTAKKMGLHKRFLYVGDLPDDILAAKAARPLIKIRSAAFPWYAPDVKTALKEIEKVRPDFILRKPSDLPQLLLHARGED